MKKLKVFLLAIVCLCGGIIFSACNEVEFKVDFYVDGAVYATINTSGNEVIKMPQDPTKENYVFDGWYWDNNLWQRPFTASSLINEPLNSDLKVYAKWTENERIQGADANFVGFEKIANGTSEYYKIVVHNDIDSFNFSDIVEVSSQTNWVLSTDINAQNTILSKSVELQDGDNMYYVTTIYGNSTKSYKLDVYRLAMYRVEFNTLGGTTIQSQQIEENSRATPPIIRPEKLCYNFSSWDFDFTQPITQNTTIYAIYTPKICTISYELNGGINNDNNPKEYTIETDTITLQNPSKTGYDFAGWFNNSNFDGNAITQIQLGSFGNLTLYAKWTPIIYNVFYYLNNGTNNSNNPTTYTIENSTTILQNPTRDAYSFDGWYDNALFEGEKITAIQQGSYGNLSFYAKWTPITYTISYELNGGVNNDNNPTEYTIESNLTLLEPSQYKEYSDFIGWYDNPSFNGNIMSTAGNGMWGNKTFYAKWKSIFIMSGTTLTGITSYGKQNYQNIPIPSNVTNIGDNAFYNYSSLNSITIPNSVTRIGNYVFYGCSKLTSITIPNNVTYIGQDAFNGCNGLTKVNIADLDSWCNIQFGNATANPAYYAKHLYMNEKEIINLDISNTVTSIKDYAFYACSSLESITFEENSQLASIGNSAFSDCSSLTSITIPSSVTSIEDYAFEDCSSLTSIIFEENSQLTSIGDWAFAYCSSLTSITIPSSVTSIGDWAFSSCYALAEVYNLSSLPIRKGSSNYGYVGYYAKVIHTNSQEESILKTINGGIYYVSGNDFVFLTPTDRNCTTFEIDSRAIEINYHAFSGCSSLTSIAIPSRVTSIGGYAFSGCSGLTRIIFESPSGWYRTTNYDDWQEKIGGTSTSLSNSSTNATYFTDTYYDYYWYKVD